MVIFWISIALSLSGEAAAPPPEHRPEHRIAEIQRFAKRQGERLWPGYGHAPFDILLLDGPNERLLCRATLPAGFTSDGIDPATGCTRAVRPASGLNPGLLAAMPLFGPPSTIVMGTPAATRLDAGGWTRTVLHEHFHQWTASLPRFYDRVAALDLAGDDKTGMWMLNYPFPYADPAVAAAHADASRALADALEAHGTPGFVPAARRYRDARRAFARAAGATHWRYAEFQLWHEGVARWTEIVLGERFADRETRASAATLRAATLRQLKSPDLAKSARTFAYAYGAGEAMLLEACDPNWRKRYPELLALGPLIEHAVERCR